MLVILIITILALLPSLYVNYNLLRKNEKLEEAMDEQYKVIVNVRNLIKESSTKIQEIDKNGAFSSDDEIGFFFRSVKMIQSIMDDFISAQPPITKN